MLLRGEMINTLAVGLEAGSFDKNKKHWINLNLFKGNLLVPV